MNVVVPIYGANSLGLSDSETADIKAMIDQWSALRFKNRVRQRYYDQKNLFRDFGISTPPQLAGLDATIGWAAKAVDVLADRIRFDRFVSRDGDDNPFGLNDLVDENDFRVLFSQAVTSALTHSCAFVVAGNEPGRVAWAVKSAEQATGLWDHSRHRLGAGLTVASDDSLIAYFPDKTVELDRRNGRWVASVTPHSLGRVPMEAVRFKPDLRRPFGRSRITRAVRYFTDGGVRTLVRSEVGAEFFAAPQRYGIGVSEEAFDLNKWNAVTGRFLTMTRDDEGELPQVGQFSQHSMQPHTDQLRQWAAQLAGETSIPINELGFVSDNPSSDAALQSQRDPLRLTADKAVTVFQSALRGLAVTSAALRGVDDVSGVSARFAPTFRVSDASAADAAVKQASVAPWVAESRVFWEKQNYTDQEIDQIMADRRRSAVSALVGSLRGQNVGSVDGAGAPAAVDADSVVS